MVHCIISYSDKNFDCIAVPLVRTKFISIEDNIKCNLTQSMIDNHTKCTGPSLRSLLLAIWLSPLHGNYVEKVNKIIIKKQHLRCQ